MSQIELERKYQNFLVPVIQILINEEDLRGKYGVFASSVTVEEAAGAASKFSFAINDAQRTLADSPMFELKKSAQINMGYSEALETVITAKISSVKTTYPSNGPPQIEVSGKTNNPPADKLTVNNPPVCILNYGSTLYSFCSTATTVEQGAAVSAAIRASAPAGNVHCTAESVGLAEIKPGVVVALAGLGVKLSQNYLVEKATHTWDSSGFKTRFEAKMQARRPPLL